MIILVAEDDVGHARLIEKSLQRAGLRDPIVHFLDGQDVLDFLIRRKTEPDSAETSCLLLLDIRMPKVDGVEVLRQIKADAALSKIPVIMLTTTDDPRETARCHALGCDHYIIKPVDYEKFAEEVRRLGVSIKWAQSSGFGLPQAHLDPAPSM